MARSLSNAKYVPAVFLIFILTSCRKGGVPIEASSREHPTAKTFLLWEDATELHKRIPDGTMTKGKEEFFRDTKIGKVKVVVGYSLDESRSHLSPTARVSTLSFKFDKDVFIREAMDAISEIREVCRNGCSLSASEANHKLSTLRAVPFKQTPEQAQLAEHLA